ncbi:MAG: hypothetical protein GC181_11625 [Bacteroidetes bacterium]|nr:hypothetical protein [Bacteroidota bacterium]
MINTQQKANDRLAAGSLFLGALLGIAGMIFQEPLLQVAVFEISSLSLVVALSVLTFKYFRSGNDLVAAGYLIFAVGESVMTAGAAGGMYQGMASFGAGMLLYVPALLLISLPKELPIIPRITGFVATIPFAIAGFKIFLGEEITYTSLFPSIGYALLTITMIFWIMGLLKKN